MQGKRWDFSRVPCIFSTFHETCTETCRRPRRPAVPVLGVILFILKELLLLYHKQPTESTFICNFLIQNCEVVYSALCPRILFAAFRHFIQFAIFWRNSSEKAPKNSGFSYSFADRILRTIVSALGDLLAKREWRASAYPLHLQPSVPAPAFCRITTLFLHLFPHRAPKVTASSPLPPSFTGISAGILSAHQSHPGKFRRIRQVSLWRLCEFSLSFLAILRELRYNTNIPMLQFQHSVWYIII